MLWREVLLTEVVDGAAKYAALTDAWAAIVARVHPDDEDPLDW